jgi:esterase/lipase superfamily enzyme
MPTTIYFATNRVVSNPLDPVAGYGAAMTMPTNPGYLTYGTAFVDGINIDANAQGFVTQIEETAQGHFPPGAAADLSQPGRNLLIFIHGFDNTFSDALTRGAFNREWLAASGVPAADTTVIAFSWPSIGRVAALPIPQADYLTDQSVARQSGTALMFFFQTLQPILRAARGSGQSVILLAHSMGNLALQAAIESWFLHGGASDVLFDHVILAAGDTTFDCFNQPSFARLSNLTEWSKFIGIYYSHADDVLKLSEVVNLGAQRLGQDGPRNRAVSGLYPAPKFAMVDCTEYRYPGFGFLTSHQYYRQSPDVRAIISSWIASPQVTAVHPAQGEDLSPVRSTPVIAALAK